MIYRNFPEVAHGGCELTALEDSSGKKSGFELECSVPLAVYLAYSSLMGSSRGSFCVCVCWGELSWKHNAMLNTPCLGSFAFVQSREMFSSLSWVRAS
jgi:hypothetical protein